MARFNLGKNTSRRTPNGSPNYDWVESRINEIVAYRSFDHYELDPAEVTSVIISDKDVQKKVDGDYRFYGAITVNFINQTNNTGVLPSGADYILPLDARIRDIPVKGEIVLVFSHPDLNKSYYLNSVNHFNTANNNIRFNLSNYGDKTTIDDVLEFDNFEPNETKARHIQISEGDIVFEGRFGQSINLGNINNEPIIKIRAGQRTDLNLQNDQQPIRESWNDDGSSIYITGFDGETTNDESINGKKILIKSDGIFINGRNNVGMSANQINLNSDNVNLGRGDKQPLVKGRELVSILQELITALNTFATVPVLNPGTLPGNAASLATAVTRVSSKLRNILSEEVQTA